MSDLETGVKIHEAMEILMAIATELDIEHSPEVDNTVTILDRAPEILKAVKKLKATNAAAHGELKLLEAAQEQMENNLKDQFDQMQVSLIAFVMWKCGRKTLAIDSREITDTAKFGAQAITVTQIDAHTTRYNVAPLKDKKNV